MVPAELLRFELLLPAFALVLARVAGMVLAVPMFASAQLPALIKVMLIAALSLMAFPLVAGKLPLSISLAAAVAGMIGEFIIGELLGLAAGAVLFGAQMAGKIVSHQSGFTLGQVVNPLFDEEVTVMDQLWFFAAFMVFLTVGGHLSVASSLLFSFDRIPPLALAADPRLLDFAVGMIESMFDVALRLAGPAILALLLASLVMGFLTKTMPQLNVLSVGFAAKIAVALGLTALTVASSEGTLVRTIYEGFEQFAGLLSDLAEAGRG